jgi:hypothetical protein
MTINDKAPSAALYRDAGGSNVTMQEFLCPGFSCRIISLLVLLLSIPAGFAQAAKPSSSPGPRIHEELIAEAHGKIVRAWTASQILYDVASGADHPFDRRMAAPVTNHVFWIEEDAGHKQSLWLDGRQQGAEYDEIRYVTPSPDYQQVALTSRHGSRWVLVVNGKDRTPEFDDMLSPDITVTGRFAVPVRKNGKWRILDNGQDVGLEFESSRIFQDTPVSDVTFDDSGSHYAFVAFRRHKWITVMDGKETGVDMNKVGTTVERRTIVPVGAGWVGRHFAVAAEINGEWSWVVDGQPGPGFDAIGELKSTRDGKHYAYAGSILSAATSSGSIAWDGKIVATHSGTGLEHRPRDLYRGVGPMTPGLNGVSDPHMLDDGTLVYAARLDKGDVTVMVKGAPGPSFEDVSDITITADGQHFSYTGWHGETMTALRDQTAGPTSLCRGARPTWIQISDNGLHLAYETDIFEHEKSLSGVTNTGRIVVDGKADPEFQAFNREKADHVRNFQFNEDGKHYAYQVTTFRNTRCFLSNNCAGDAQNFLVVDGGRLDAYERVFPGTSWVDERTVQFIARKGQRLLRITCDLGD